MPPSQDNEAFPQKPRWRRFLTLDMAALLLGLIVLLGDALFMAPPATICVAGDSKRRFKSDHPLRPRRAVAPL